MLNLIVDQQALDTFIESTSWHGAYVREFHFTPSGKDSDISLLRILIGAPEENYALELVAFDVESFEINPSLALEDGQSGVVQRREIEVDFHAFALICGCLAYVKLPVEVLGQELRFASENPFDQYGNFKPPYDTDWRIALDEATRSRS